MIIVAPTSPKDPEASALLRASHALMQSLFPPEDNFFLDIEELCTDDIRFFTARIDGHIVGTGALALKEGYGEVKSMFVDESARGKGVADAILRQIEDEARALDLPLLRLETGNVLYAAHRLYERHGYAVRGPFGDYPAAPSSIFMERTL
ncbi:GNAT family N-acetyltransferase [uncultured Roseovarius sp.]|uniref:GNAT family N-acetyltransferase n=1 Tax=uncultured Roseovarius sp. TaxID=293344 RepID=UPI0025F175CF|nr:GNAT family N-acetyltransferase [uncultured Roseovarius sp.]